MSRIDQQERRDLQHRTAGMRTAIVPFLPIAPILPVLPPVLPPEVLSRQFLERPGGVVAASGISVSRQVHQVKRSRWTPVYAVDVGFPSLARGRARSCDPLTDQGIDQARLADIRSAGQRQFGEAVAGEPRAAHRARDECGVYLQSCDVGLGIRDEEEG